jgi:hypothetical protein
VFAERAAVVLLLLAGCGRVERREQGGITAEVRGDRAILSAGTQSTSIERTPQRLSLTPWKERGPLTFTASIGGIERRIATGSLITEAGAPALRHVLEGGRGEIVVGLDPTLSAVVVSARAEGLPRGESITLRASFLHDDPVVLEHGGPFTKDEVLPAVRTSWAIFDGMRKIVASSPTGLVIEADTPFAATSTAISEGEAGAEARIVFAEVAAVREGAAIGARLAGVPPRTTADLVVEIRDAGHDAMVPARIYIEGKPRAPGAKIIWDPTRDAERTTPLVDVTVAHTNLTLPEGTWTIRATRGLGWSIARKEFEVVAGDAMRATFDLIEEDPQPAFIGCDFHVHARGSWDARPVSYAERVRSLVAVGVDCAAATEHNHVGDHGPAAAVLGLDHRLRALSGVELTTGGPAFGHFNVYPWPIGAPLPETQGTTWQALFDAIHATPGSFVFQVNHPRMKTADGSRIGYLDHAGVDPKTGDTRGRYRDDYDALEIFNGFELDQLAGVEAITEEWLRMLDRGEFHAATGSSDSHGIAFPWAGFPRTFVAVGEGWRTNGRPVQAIVDAVKAGRAYVSSGPILDVRVNDAKLGDTCTGPEPTARIRVAPTSWLGRPRIRARLGLEDLGELTPTHDAGGWYAEIELPKVDRRRPFVVMVDAEVVGEGVGLFGFRRTLAITNPIWIAP